MKTALDTKWYIRAQDSIAQGALTNSKRAECFVKTIYPVHLTKGRGCYVWDTQGNRYIDFICGLGSNLLGYGNSLIAESMYRQALEGCTLSLSTTLEVVVAEKIKEVVPFVEKMKFLKTGTEACMAAIRIARAYHGVSRENQEMYEMFGNPSYRGLPQEWSEKEKSLQVLYNGLSTETRNQRNQKSGPAEIRTFSEGQTNREKALAEAMGAGQSSWEGQNLLFMQEKIAEAALRDMPESEIASASSRLYKTSGSDLALPNPSLPRSPRTLILTEGYHGHIDSMIGLTPPHNGVISDPYMLLLKGNEHLIPMAAAVMIEPVLCELTDERLEWLRKLREETKKHGALLIFDEVITGFRFPKFSFSSHSNIVPDLIVMGKAMANGMPIGLVGGPTNIMNCGEYFVSSTFAGETLSLTACLKTIEHLQAPKFSLNTLWDRGGEFKDKFNQIWPQGLRIQGYNTRGAFEGDQLTKALFWQESVRAGLLFGASWFINFSHIPLIDEVLSNCRDILVRIKNNMGPC